MPLIPPRREALPEIAPHTPREALLMVATLATKGGVSDDDFRRVAVAGLQPSATFELTDELADRLAVAHRLLREIREGTELAVIAGEIEDALALPPDLEAMVERRLPLPPAGRLR